MASLLLCETTSCISSAAIARLTSAGVYGRHPATRKQTLQSAHRSLHTVSWPIYRECAGTIPSVSRYLTDRTVRRRLSIGNVFTIKLFRSSVVEIYTNAGSPENRARRALHRAHIVRSAHNELFQRSRVMLCSKARTVILIRCNKHDNLVTIRTRT